MNNDEVKEISADIKPPLQLLPSQNEVVVDPTKYVIKHGRYNMNRKQRRQFKHTR